MNTKYVRQHTLTHTHSAQQICRKSHISIENNEVYYLHRHSIDMRERNDWIKNSIHRRPWICASTEPTYRVSILAFYLFIHLFFLIKFISLEPSLYELSWHVCEAALSNPFNSFRLSISNSILKSPIKRSSKYNFSSNFLVLFEISFWIQCSRQHQSHWVTQLSINLRELWRICVHDRTGKGNLQMETGSRLTSMRIHFFVFFKLKFTRDPS